MSNERDDFDFLLDRHNETARYFRQAKISSDAAIASLETAIDAVGVTVGSVDLTVSSVRTTLEAVRETARSARGANESLDAAITQMLAANEAALRLRRRRE